MQALGVLDSVNLARKAASRPTQLLSIGCDTGPMLMHAHDRCIDHLRRGIVNRGQRSHNLVPDASPRRCERNDCSESLWSVALWKCVDILR